MYRPFHPGAGTWTRCTRLSTSLPSRRLLQVFNTGITGATRHASLEAGEGKTGHIEAGPDKAIIYFDNVYPLHLAWLLRFPWSPAKTLPELMDRVQPGSIFRTNPVAIIKEAKSPAKVTEYLPRLKEGGAFVKLELPANMTAAEVEESLDKYMKETGVKPWWNPFRRMRARLVRGKPWVEDLYRLPSARLKVEFLPTKPGDTAADVSQEQLYEFFRPYGKLADIEVQPPDSKILPKFAHLNFMGMRRAIMAKNCIHGFVVDEAKGGGKTGTVLRISYDRKAKTNWMKDWLVNHPRIVIPIAAALLAGLSVVIFDPIRTFFIKAHVKQSFHFSDSNIIRWFKSQATDILSFRKKKANDETMKVIWDDRKSNINQIRTWLLETADTFIIVQGPRGSGKKELVVDQSLKHNRLKLVIDCKPIQEARGDSATIGATATQVGYRPLFSFLNTVSGWIDLAAQGATGMKTGFSETLDTQLAKIFNNTATALRQIALEGRHSNDSDAGLGDDEWLEAHPEKRVVVVVDNFLHKSQESLIVYDKLAEWAAGITTANIAHVIFLTHDVSFSKSLSKALPDRVFRHMSLGDCSAQAAKQFVISHVEADWDSKSDDPDNPKKLTPSQRREDLSELDECIESVGGRITDLEFLARRIKMGETPRKAVREIVEQSACEILKMYIFNCDESNMGQRRWTPEQAWLLIKQLATSPNASLRYNEIILDDSFKTNSTGDADAVLEALEQAELISVVVASNGRPHAIKPGKPVYLAAFQRLTEDKVLQSRLDLAILTELIKIENAGVDKYEKELQLLAELPKQPAALADRLAWLLGKIHAGHAKVDRYEKDSAVLKGVLSTDY